MNVMKGIDINMSQTNPGGQKFYQQSWFIMLLLFSPLFPIGLFLAWRDKTIHIAFKIFFTCVWVYTVIYTIQTLDFSFNFTPEGTK